MLNDSRLVRPAAVAATLLLASSLVALPACSQTSTTTSSPDAQSTSAASDTQSVTFTDDLGREVTVSNPQRVVACMAPLPVPGSLRAAPLLAPRTMPLRTTGLIPRQSQVSASRQRSISRASSTSIPISSL